MTYDPGIPTGSQYLSDSQPAILENFSQLNTLFAINHVTFNDVTAVDRGKHTFVTMIEQADSPGTAINEMALYTKEEGGVTELFLQREDLAAAGADIQMTFGTPSVAANGYTFLPGGLLLQWGSVNATAVGADFTFPIAFPTAVYSVTLGGRSAGVQSFVMTAPALNKVKVLCTAGPQVCYVMAIGK